MREKRLGRWVARISVMLGLGVATFGGVVVLSAGSAVAAPDPSTLHPAADTSIVSTGSTTFQQNHPVIVYQTDGDIVWW